MYRMNFSSQCETYSSLPFSHLTCVIITMDIWNNPPTNTQAKQKFT